MNADIIPDLLANFVIATLIYVLQTQRIQEKDKIIDRLQSKLDACETAEDNVLRELADFYKVNTMIPPPKHKKAPESGDSGASANGT
jgi:hypothetical protein